VHRHFLFFLRDRDDISLCIQILPEIKQAPRSTGIEMPFPQRTIWFGNAPPSTGAEGSVHKKA